MDGFHTFASNRCGLSFSAFEVAASRSSPLAATERVPMMLTANPRNAALHPGGFFTAKSVGNASVRSQARRLLNLSQVSGQLDFGFSMLARPEDLLLNFGHARPASYRVCRAASRSEIISSAGASSLAVLHSYAEAKPVSAGNRNQQAGSLCSPERGHAFA
jgi:hypothetical protein